MENDSAKVIERKSNNLPTFQNPPEPPSTDQE